MARHPYRRRTTSTVRHGPTKTCGARPAQSSAATTCFTRASAWTIRLGFVANLAQEVMKRQLPLSIEGLGSQGGEQCGRRKALPSLCDYELSLLDHGHEFDADERGRCRVKGFEP